MSHLHHIATSDITVSMNVGPDLRPGGHDKGVCHFKVAKIFSLFLALTLTLTVTLKPLDHKQLQQTMHKIPPTVYRMCRTTLCIHSTT